MKPEVEMKLLELMKGKSPAWCLARLALMEKHIATQIYIKRRLYNV